MQSTSRNPVFFTYRMPFGKLTIASDGANIVRVALGEHTFDGECASDALTNECANQMAEYLAGKRSEFDIPMKYDGTEFMQKAWEAMLKIPYSQTRTNAELAEAIGQPNAYRMIGQAVKKNPLVILIPAHRIVPANGYVDKTDERAMLRAAFRELERKYA